MFRARLEGQESPIDPSTMSRSRSHGQLTGQRAVSTMLDSQFRHRLESMLSHRLRAFPTHMRETYIANDNPPTTVTTTPAYAPVAQENTHFTTTNLNPRQTSDINAYRGVTDSDALEAIVSALREEVTVLRNVVNASFDLQLDIQRSIRQEVAAAMNKPAPLPLHTGMGDTSTCTTSEASSSSSTHPDFASRPTASNSHSQTPSTMVTKSALRSNGVNAGTCSICLESSVDSLLYGCGHMCTCTVCGRQLLAAGQSCPICRAPVRDVVKAYIVAQ